VKRSEIVKVISDQITLAMLSYNSGDLLVPMQLARDILKMAENAGMLPPPLPMHYGVFECEPEE